MARTLVLFPDAHAIPRGKLITADFRNDLEIGFSCGVFTKDIFGTRQLFDRLAAPFGGGDIKVRPEEGAAWVFEPQSDLVFGASRIAIGTVTDPLQRPHPLDFRGRLREFIKQRPRLNDYRFGAELEFYLYPLEGSLALRPDRQAYAFAGASALQTCIEAMLSALDRIGLSWNDFSQESGFHQYEITLQQSAPLEQADRIFLARLILRSVAARHGLRCTFLTVVDEEEPPSNLHLHISDTVDPTSEHFDMLCSGVATALSGPFLALSPTANARRAKGIDSFASKKVDLGEDDRLKALRTITSGAGKRVEIRTASSDSNPYLVILLLLGCIQSVAEDANEAPAFVEKDIEWDFLKSIEAFSRDSVVRKLLGDEAIELYTQLKRKEQAHAAELDFASERALLEVMI
jgi:glutamine synthetase